MLWWRRNDGFEWKEYVRTTVLLRRQQRRDKIDAARHAAAEGLKEAGRKGIAAGSAGAEAAGQAAARLAKSAAGRATDGAERGLGAFSRGAAALRYGIAAASAPLNARLARPSFSRWLAVIALATGLALAIRAYQFGFDTDTTLLAILAVTTALMWSWPHLFPDPASQDSDDWDEEAAITSGWRAAVNSVGTPSASSLLLAAAALLVAAGLWMGLPIVADQFAHTTAAPAATPPPAESAETLSGTARVAGPGLLRVEGTRLRLADVTMPAWAQTCRRDDGTTFACGQAARQALERSVRGRRAVVCTPTGGDEDARIATCTVGGKDIAAELVRSGHAFADGTFWARYAAEEAEARAARAGLWAGGAPERPDVWQARVWEEAAAAAPDGCPIKGRVQSGRKSYVMPTAADYPRMTLRQSRGDRWFCSIEEAEAAGFRPRDEN